MDAVFRQIDKVCKEVSCPRVRGMPGTPTKAGILALFEIINTLFPVHGYTFFDMGADIGRVVFYSAFLGARFSYRVEMEECSYHIDARARRLGIANRVHVKDRTMVTPDLNNPLRMHSIAQITGEASYHGANLPMVIFAFIDGWTYEDIIEMFRLCILDRRVRLLVLTKTESFKTYTTALHELNGMEFEAGTGSQWVYLQSVNTKLSGGRYAKPVWLLFRAAPEQ